MFHCYVTIIVIHAVQNTENRTLIR